ncbi:MAG: hypothetical protein HY519_04680, partial [Candidatus Aenigmarchaeota archaeon]|nr:hypothetical protein [Candidatus Aenigmarchaeota archaeon]
MADQRAKLRRAAAKAAVVYLSDYLKTFLGQAYVGLDSGRTSDEFVKALARKPALRKK